MIMRLAFLLSMMFILGLFMWGCAAREATTLSGYKATVRSARAVLPVAVQMEEVFPKADHFITHFGMVRDEPATWNTEVFFGGQYTLTMQVEVVIDYDHNSILRAVGQPAFFMRQHQNVIEFGDGRIQTSFRNEWRFGLEDWHRIYAGRGNLAAIGVTNGEGAVEGFDRYVSQVRRDRIGVSLLDD